MSGTPWNDYGLIAYVAKNVHGLGKTKLHKLIYLIKEIGEVPIGFNFRFYNYGPYSDNLAETLDFVNSLDGVIMKYDPRMNMYEITPGECADKLIEKASSNINTYKTSIDSMLTTYGGKLAKELELISTIIYANRNYKLKDDDSLASTTCDLKPKFNLVEIKSAIEQLRTEGLLIQ
jgi:uncharacterized protein YwgA